MRLTRDEYLRGLLSWAPDPPAVAYIRSGEGHETTYRTGPMVNPAGSVVPDQVELPLQLVFGVRDPNEHAAPYQARLERLHADGAVRTQIWDSYDGEEVRIALAHVPGYGYFHRMVIAGTLLVWDEDVVIRCGDVLVRFVSDVVVGEHAPPMTDIKAIEGGYAIEGPPIGTATLTGRFVDIVAPGLVPARGPATRAGRLRVADAAVRRPGGRPGRDGERLRRAPARAAAILR